MNMLFLKSEEYVGYKNSVNILRREPQADYPEHRHDFSELILVSSGIGNHTVNDDFSVMLPNTIACVSERDYHQFSDSQDLILLNVAYNKDFLSVSRSSADVIKKLENDQNHFMILEDDFKPLNNIALRIKEENERQDVHASIMASILFEQLLLSIDRLSVGSFDQSPLMKSVVYLCNNYFEQDLSVNHICDMFKVTPKALSSKLVQLTGLSTNRFINHLRVHRAMAMLKNGKSITDVAFRVGYNDSNYFSTKFKAVAGCSPREYLGKNKILSN
ncbi:helix-turn-helix domain-containing protein [Vibrio sp.]|uniref:Helix-turn-helix domain-containing protein n=1 Tax=Vibrio viridaestus TaxID=2487322 RepID=A0A3N9TCW7_9VIBR|nr:helix-turn-helix domain-containing protein [Vibrio viridaestus]MDC0610249.1 helix-turn-helix domain-containing protein [Vibrio sp.]RQW61890.1 helix-turn-helix domain-containing protein [Vibrio viridaestus]